MSSTKVIERGLEVFAIVEDATTGAVQEEEEEEEETEVLGTVLGLLFLVTGAMTMTGVNAALTPGLTVDLVFTSAVTCAKNGDSDSHATKRVFEKHALLFEALIHSRFCSIYLTFPLSQNLGGCDGRHRIADLFWQGQVLQQRL